MTVTVNLEKQQAIDLYSKMLLIRRFEEESERLYRRGMIRGFLHTYIGEEAIAAGANILVAGTAAFAGGEDSYRTNLARLRGSSAG